jgi:hypothetical protein
MLHDKEEVKKRWTEYCSSLHTTTSNSNTMTTELEKITPPNEDELHEILFVEVEAVVKILKKKKPRHQ